MLAKKIHDQISHNPASTYTKSNLQFYQKWTAGPKCTFILHSVFTWRSAYPNPVKTMGGWLAPFRGHGFVVMLCNQLKLHRELATSDYHSIWSDLNALRGHKGPKLGLWTPLVFLLHLIPITTTCGIITGSKKNLLKIRHTELVHPHNT